MTKSDKSQGDLQKQNGRETVIILHEQKNKTKFFRATSIK